MKLRNYFNIILNSAPKQTYLLFAKKLFPKYFQELFDNLKKIPRYTAAKTALLGKNIEIADAPSFFSMYNEIFKKEIYKFKTEAKKPYIIDCGANIGLSIIYFKKLYPEAEIVGFEPDKRIFDMLKNNMQSFGYNNVKIIQKALWNKGGETIFSSEGADAGRLADKNEMTKLATVMTTSLRSYLGRPVDFLKIDIEGAETVVIEDCANLLINVKNLFVEYHSFSDKEQKLDTLLGILKKAGFRYYIYNFGVLSHHPFEEKKTYLGMDTQLNIYACRF
ncbi:MAG: FkbM family methyltransferase [Patescibacteria group bacterium]